MSRSRNRKRARSKAQKNEDNTNLETSSNKQRPSDVNTTVDTLMQADSTDLLLFPEHHSRDNVSTTATVSCQTALLEVESAAKLPSTKPMELDLNPVENHLENNVAGKKKKKKKKKKQFKQSPSDVNTTVDTLMQADSTDLLLFPEHLSRHNVSTTATVSCQNALLEVESSAKLPSTKPMELDLNPIENHLENNVAGKKKKKKKRKKNKNKCTAAMTNLQVTLPNAESAVQLPAQEPLQVTFPKAESAVQLPAQELQGLDMNLANNLEESGNRKQKKRKKKNLNKPTRDVLDVDSTAKLLATKNQERDINMSEIEEKSASGQKSANGKKKRKKKNLNKPESNVIDVETTTKILVPEHQERDTNSRNDLEEKTANGRKRKRGENIVKHTSDDKHVEFTAQQLPPDNQEKKKKKKSRKVKKAANNNIDNVKTATQDSLSSEREDTEALCAGFEKLCPEDVTVVSVQTEHSPVKATTISCENFENGSYLAFPEKNSVESCSEGTHLPSSAEVTMHYGTHLRKLLILDLNGLLADIVMPPPKDCKADTRILGRAIFKRPFCDDFLKFCFDRFNVGIWSSRSKKVIRPVVDYLLGDLKHELLFCWDMSHSTTTSFKTLENWHKPLVCKDLRKVWEKRYPVFIPWEKGDYDESNTLLLDDSPYKALLNPVHTTIFPYSYNFRLENDNSLGPGGDLRVYLENLADAEHVQKYVEEHPFGQQAISEKSTNWGFYSKVIKSIRPSG